ncbi:hypothetical protein FIBSPDRAFT_1041235 [Athelia psychrophila]|uniref:Zn(2)-C6 fungal-type domain-containing protein n=1 Tax=Athelia psychrophila TaxID=1759441 RepID=A0A166PAC3_9AGAM|nr:hypothetical protein FIBSPDRAFT_1041235 [Fibularhizoctonia sp. CBS 109695]
MERREKKKMACFECRKRKEKCAPVDRLDDCNACKENGRLCVYVPVAASQSPSSSTALGSSPSPPTSISSSPEWQSSIAIISKSDARPDVQHQSTTGQRRAPDSMTRPIGGNVSSPSRETISSGDTSPTCSCDGEFRCILHDPKVELWAHLMDDKMMEDAQPYVPPE